MPQPQAMWFTPSRMSVTSSSPASDCTHTLALLEQIQRQGKGSQVNETGRWLTVANLPGYMPYADWVVRSRFQQTLHQSMPAGSIAYSVHASPPAAGGGGAGAQRTKVASASEAGGLRPLIGCFQTRGRMPGSDTDSKIPSPCDLSWLIRRKLVFL